MLEYSWIKSECLNLLFYWYDIKSISEKHILELLAIFKKKRKTYFWVCHLSCFPLLLEINKIKSLKIFFH